MGKLTYVNRKIEGIKLGQVVAKDLLKRIPPAHGHKAALRDPSIELDISGKAIDDEAVQELCGALVKAITANTEGSRLTLLEDLCLKGNEVTARGLADLAEVVRAAASDLRDLDLASNKITVSTEEEAYAFSLFLSAFEPCAVLRRLDLSGNDLGPKGFEILAKVYGREPFVPVPRRLAFQAVSSGLRAKQASSTVTLSALVKELHLGGHDTEEAIEDGESSPKRRQSRASRVSSMSQSSDKHSPQKLAPELLAFYSGTKGLRSIPYIVLSDTCSNDTCAMYLSFVVAEHQDLPELRARVPPARAGLQAQQLESCDSIVGCEGLIWKPNPKLTSTGLKVLELAERKRGGATTYAEDDSRQDDETRSSLPFRGISEMLPTPMTQSSRRRGSVSSISAHTPTVPLPKTQTDELHRARSRIQGDTIRDAGARSNDLWKAALKMLRYARPILCAQHEPILPDDSFATIVKEINQIPMISVPKPSPARRPSKTEAPIFNKVVWPRLPLTNPAIPPLSIVSTNSIKILRPTRRKESVVSPAIESPLSRHGKRVGLDSGEPRDSLAPLGQEIYRSELVLGFHEHVWASIIAYAADVSDEMSQDQQLQVIQYARSRSSLHREMECLGKAESAQIWRLLDAIECLEYE